MFDSEQFENAINDGRYIDVVNETLKAGSDDDKEDLRDKLFGGKERLFEKALRQAIVAKNSSWIAKLYQKKIPDWWSSPSWGTANDPSYDYYKDYRSRFIKTQLKAALIIVNEKENQENQIASLANNIDFPPCILHDFVAIFGSDELSSLKGISLIKVPVLLVDDNKEGYVASLFLEQVDIEGVDSPPYPHPVKMSGIPIDKHFEKAVEDAFHFLRGYLTEKIPVFRWWVKPLSPSKKIKGIKGPSVYGAFLVGMYGSTLKRKIPDALTITCSGNLSGDIFSINGFAQKFQAATTENLKIVVSGKQNYDDEDNLITDEQKKQILVADTAVDVFGHFFEPQKPSPPENTEETARDSTSIQTQSSKEPSPSISETTLEQVPRIINKGITDWKSFIYKLIAIIAGIVGIAGLSILFALFTYELLIEAIKEAKNIPPKLRVLLYISLIASVFFIVVLAIYAGLKEKVLGFILLVVIILSFIGGVIYLFYG